MKSGYFAARPNQMVLIVLLKCVSYFTIAVKLIYFVPLCSLLPATSRKFYHYLDQYTDAILTGIFFKIVPDELLIQNMQPLMVVELSLIWVLYAFL